MQYRNDIDTLKGIAIIAVVLFHLGVVKSGYLGVDIFLVINGFLIVPSLCEKMVTGKISYFSFIKARLMRLWPMVVLLSLVCLAIGYIGMLPDDYENLGESAVASNLFSENILLSITTKDYWNVSNDYNPLMHLWYVGVIFEFYLLYPLVVTVVGGGKRQINRQLCLCVTILLCIVSLVIYLSPNFDDSAKFYYLPFRLFEFLLGGLCGLLSLTTKVKRLGYYGLLGLLVVLVYSSIVFLDFQSVGTDVLKIGGDNIIEPQAIIFPKQVMLLSTVLLVLLLIMSGVEGNRLKSRFLSYVGKRSYSLFIWHQAMIAFFRYFYSSRITVVFLIVFIVVLLLLSEATYSLVEKRFVKYKHSLPITIVAVAIVIICGGGIYMRAGVVRDVPELDVQSGKAYRGMHAAYVDRIYQYNVDFLDANGRMNVLVEGNSYGRDMANILLESEYKDSINLSYLFQWKEDAIERIRRADCIFTFCGRNEVPAYVWKNMKPTCLVYGIGTKNYGQCNGVFYRNRNSDGYFNQTAPLNSWYWEKNEEWRKEWGDNYIDLLRLSLVDGKYVRVFTDDKRYMSQDCYHLTRAGAQWYARQLNFEKILKRRNKRNT